jgi:signal peptidase I
MNPEIIPPGQQFKPEITPVANPSTLEPNLHIEPSAPKPYVDPIVPVSESPKSSNKPRKKPRSYAFKGFLSIVQLVTGAIILAFIINNVVFQSYEVFGMSMAPTLHEGDRLIISKLGKSWSSLTREDYLPKRGEIIVFHNPRNTSVQLIKRVVGLPGDRVSVEDGVLTVFNNESPSGFQFDDVFNLDLPDTDGLVNIVVPEGEIFVVGDNRLRGGSLDSRNDLGTVPIEQIVGDLVIRIFPLSDAGLF